MFRTKLWAAFMIGGGLYAAAKIGFGWQDAKTALATVFDMAYWSGAIMLLHWATLRRVPL